MQSTPNYNYNLPEYSDSADIAVLNANFSSIDANEYRIEGKLNALGNDIALPYDNTATYSVGDYTIYNNALYRCITAIATAEDFDSTKWTAITIGGELKSHDTRISTLEAGVDLEKSATNSFDDGIDSYFKKVVSTIVPVQAGSGTPSPTNVRAISGFTECVIKDFGNNFMPQKDVSVPDTQTNVAINLNLPKGTYTISANISTDGSDTSFRYNIRLNNIVYANGFLDTSGGRASSTFTIDQDCNQVYLYGGASSLTQANTTYTDIQIERGSRATDYTPYVTPNTATISFGSAGTVYGGYVDLISGKLVVDRKETKPTTIYGVLTNYLGIYYWTIALGENSVPGGDIISSHFIKGTTIQAGNMYITGADGRTLVVVPTDQSLNTKALADAWLQANKPQFVYKLATPQEYQLTPAQLRSLVGANRLTSSTGEVTEVEYITNETIAYVDDKVEKYEAQDDIRIRTLDGIRQDNAGFHNSIYRGKFLGTSITAEQYAQISAGTFDDLYIGDYWTISTTLGSTTKNVDYVIAGFDYWWNVGDTFPQGSNKHHVVLVTRTSLYNAKMNATNTTTGGYLGSEMYTDNLTEARTGIGNAFSGHIYTVRRVFSNSVGADGQANGWTWGTSTVDLMSEVMVYGTKVWGNSGYEIGTDKTILPLFALNFESVNTRAYYWLRNVHSSTNFSLVLNDGASFNIPASSNFGVRPCFAIYGGD